MGRGWGASGQRRARQTEGTGRWQGHLGEKEGDEPDGGKWALMGGSVWGRRGRQIERRWERGRRREGGTRGHLSARDKNLQGDSGGDEWMEGCHTPDLNACVEVVDNLPTKPNSIFWVFKKKKKKKGIIDQSHFNYSFHHCVLLSTDFTLLEMFKSFFTLQGAFI